MKYNTLVEKKNENLLCNKDLIKQKNVRDSTKFEANEYETVRDKDGISNIEYKYNNLKTFHRKKN